MEINDKTRNIPSVDGMRAISILLVIVVFLTGDCAHRHAPKHFRITVKEDDRNSCDEPQPVDFEDEGASGGNTPKRIQRYPLQASSSSDT